MAVPEGQPVSLKSSISAIARAVNLDLVGYWSPRHPVGRRMRLMSSLDIDLVLDVGANEGQFALELRRMGYKGRIVSIEPLTGPFGQLARTAARDPGWETIQSAAGSSVAASTMHIAANRGASSSLLPMLDLHAWAAPQARYVSEERVRTEPLDAIVAPYLSRGMSIFTKLDVQGYELQVLAGGRETIMKSRLVQVELSLLPLYEGAPTFLDVVEFMGASGFTLVGLDPGFSSPTGVLLQADGLFAEERKLFLLEGESQ